MLYKIVIISILMMFPMVIYACQGDNHPSYGECG